MLETPGYYYSDTYRVKPLGIRGLIGVSLNASFNQGRPPQYITLSERMDALGAYAPVQPTLSISSSEYDEIKQITAAMDAASQGITLEKIVTEQRDIEDSLDILQNAYETNNGAHIKEIYDQALARRKNRTLLYT
jgi:hypothetical protein